MPLRIFLIKLLTVISQEEKSKNGKEDSPKGSPHTYMVNEGLKADPIVEDIGRKLEIEGNSVRIIGQTIYFGDLFLNGVDLKILCVLS